MDYTMDFVLEANDDIHISTSRRNASFTYNDTRLGSRLYVGLKLLGVVVYASTLLSCSADASLYYFYMSMICVMTMSTANSARYEYCHYKRCGSSFYSVEEFVVWKHALWPRSRVVFSVTEIVLKLGYFVYTFPLKFDLITQCSVGESIFKIHTLTVFLIYVITGITLAVMILSFYFCNILNSHIVPFTVPIQIPIQAPIQIQIQRAVQIDLQDKCCVCLEEAYDDASTSWSILVCGHKFHTACVSKWLTHSNTCPICRTTYEV